MKAHILMMKKTHSKIINHSRSLKSLQLQAGILKMNS